MIPSSLQISSTSPSRRSLITALVVMSSLVISSSSACMISLSATSFIVISFILLSLPFLSHPALPPGISVEVCLFPFESAPLPLLQVLPSLPGLHRSPPRSPSDVWLLSPRTPDFPEGNCLQDGLLRAH